MDQKSIITVLNNIPLFSSYSKAELQQVLDFSRPLRVVPGDVLFSSGEACSHFYVVLSGVIKLYKVTNDGHEKIIEVVEAGQSFAEAALFSGNGYPVSASPLSEVEVLAIKGIAFSRFLQQNPRLSWLMLATLSSRLHQLVGQVENLTLRNTEQRIAAYLLD